MRFKFVPLEERILLDAAGAAQVSQTYDQQHSTEQAQDQAQTQQQHVDNPGAGTGNNEAVDGRVLVISSQIHDSALLADAANDNVTVITYDFNTSLADLAQTIADKLGGEQATSIGFALLGADGQFSVTNEVLMSAQTLETDTEQQAFWREMGSLVKSGGSIDILACDVVVNTEGLKLVTQIDNLLDSAENDHFVSVNASMDKTGNADDGGNWNLEVGQVDAVTRYFDSQKIQQWDNLLDAPYQVKDINAGALGSQPQLMTQLGDKVVFVTTTADYHFQLWISDGTNSGTKLLNSEDTWYNGQKSVPSLRDFVELNGKLYFVAPDPVGSVFGQGAGVNPDGIGVNALWSTDGTAANTGIFKSFSGAGIEASGGTLGLTKIGGFLYFYEQSTNSSVSGIWRSDGTSQGTVRIRASTSEGGQFTAVGNTIYFTEKNASGGNSLVALNGSTFTTVKDGAGTSNSVSNLTNVNGTLYFSTKDSGGISSLWTTNGTAAGTRVINTGLADHSSIIASGGKLFFIGSNSSGGTEVFSTDGTLAGTKPVSDVTAGTAAFKPSSLVASNGTLFWIENSGSTTRLYASDGTAAGTRQVTVPDVSGLILYQGAQTTLMVGAGTTPKVIFYGQDRYGGLGLFTSDGTNEGTKVFNGISYKNSIVPNTIYTNASNSLYEGTMVDFIDSSGKERFFFNGMYSNIVDGGELFSTIASPEGVNKNFVTAEDTTLNGSGTNNVLYGATDSSGKPLTVILKASPYNGTLNLNSDGTFTYTPKANYNGTDTFRYTISNGTTESAVVYTATIAVTAVNDAPVAQGASVTTKEDTQIGGKVRATDVDSFTLTYSIVTGPANGTVTLNATTGDYIYTPKANYNGTDSFTFKSYDGKTFGNNANVNITITPVNDAPVAVASSATGMEDAAAITGTVKATDIDSTSLTYSVVTQPTKGTVTLNATTGDYVYNPVANFNGTDSFTFRASDGALLSAVATVSLNVMPVNDAPVSQDSSIETEGNVPVSGTVVATDIDSSTLSYSIATDPVHGTLTLDATTGNYTYTPNAGYVGTDSFTFKASDGALISNVSAVNINVAAPVVVDPTEQAPVGEDTSVIIGESKPYVTDQNTPLRIDASYGLGSDAIFEPGDSFSGVRLLSGGYLGTIALNSDGSFIYTPNKNASGVDTFTYSIGNNQGHVSDPITVHIQVDAVNQAPVGTDNYYTSTAGQAYTTRFYETLLTRAVDPEGNAMSIQLVSGPKGGSVDLNPTTGMFTYTPSAGANGMDSFKYVIKDSEGATSKVYTANISIMAASQPTNVPESVLNATDSTNINVVSGHAYNGMVSVFYYDRIVMGSSTAILVSKPMHGTVVFTSGSSGVGYVYTPDVNWHGTDSFTYKAVRGSSWSDVATVSFNVAADSAPTGDVKTYTAPQNSTLTTSADIGLLAGANDAEGDTVTASLVLGTGKGVVSLNPDGSFSYTPYPGMSGQDMFTYKLVDHLGIASAAMTATINIAPDAIDIAPISQAIEVTTAEDTAFIGELPVTDVDSTELTYTIMAQPLHGSVTVDASGNYTYTPAANYSGADNFSFKANDGTNDSNISTVSINVAAVNDAPVAAAVSVSTAEDSPVKITLSGSDIDSSALTYSIVTQPAHGTVSKDASGNFIYTPAANYNGQDSFTYKANDGALDSSASTVTINVAAVNDAPVAAAVSVSTAEDSPVKITFAGSDIDSSALTYSIVTQPSHGTVSKDASGNFIYTPAANYNGQDSFTYKANDGALDSSASTVTINVAAVNDAPVVAAVSVSTAEDAPVKIMLSGSDIDSSALIYSIVTQPAHGTISKDASGNFIYTPAANYNGQDSFTYKANDGALDSSAGTVTVNIAAVNDAPTSQAASVITKEDTPFTGKLPATDLDSINLTYTITTQPAHGTLSVNASGNYTYTPAANYNGADSFSFKANDGALDSNTSTVNINVTAVNDAPIAQAVSLTIAEDTPFTGQLPATDLDSPNLTYTLVKQPTHGTLWCYPSGQFIYTPHADYNGPDSFTFTANDGTNNSNVSTVSINVTSATEAPVVQYAQINPIEDTPFAGKLPVTDADSANLTYAITTQPLHGTVSVDASGNYIYTPAANYNGADSFTFKANDDTNNSVTGSVNIYVMPANDAPITQDVSITTAEDTRFSGKVTATDVDSVSLRYTLVEQPSHGTLLFYISGNYTYTPDANYNGPDSFSFKVNDGTLNSNISSVNINVTSVNDAPVAQAVSVITAEDTPVTGVLPATDLDSANLSYIITMQPTHGTVSVDASGNYSYIPDANYIGADSFSFKAYDGARYSNNSIVSINVTDVNDAPISQDASVTAVQDTPFTGNLLATDNDSVGLSFSITEQPAHGTVFVDAVGNYTYTPDAYYNGADSFSFTANDGNSDSNVSTVSIVVTAVNIAPISQAASVTTAEDTPFTGKLPATDIDSANLSFSVTAQPAHGTVSVDAAGNYKYTPDANFNGVDSFSFKANDGIVDSNISTVSINVTAVNDAPVSQAASVTTAEDSPITGKLLATDIDSANLSFNITTQPAHGTVSVDAAGNYKYTPDANFNGVDSFAFVANDGENDSNISTVSINVTAANDAPVSQGDSVTTLEDTLFTGKLPATDLDSESLSFNITAQPAHGTVSVDAAGNYKYTPDANFNGVDSFSFVANDGENDSNISTVSINVTAVNDAPVSQGDSVTTLEDTLITGKLPATDLDSANLSFSITTQPAHGTVSVDAAGNYKYTPDANFNGVDNFSFVANDGENDSNISTVSINVTAVNDATVSQAASVTTAEDTPITGKLPATDLDSANLSFSITTQPAHGTVSVDAAGNYKYTPDANFNGVDNFSFVANDGENDSNISTVSINVTAVNDATVSQAASVTTAEDTPITGKLPATDIDSANLSYSITAEPEHGTVFVDATGNYTYTPDANYNGVDSFSFVANDGNSESNTSTVSINVTAVNDAPLSQGASVTTAEDTLFTGQLPATDLDSANLSYTITTQPAHGTVTVDAAGNYEYTPDANFNGTDSFFFTAHDGANESNISVVSINVTAVDDEPEPQVDIAPEPVVEIEPEPIVEVEPEPQVEVEPEPIVEVEPEPQVEVEPEPIVDIVPEPQVEVEPEPIVDIAPEPIVDIVPEPQVEVEPEPIVDIEPEPMVDIAPEPQVEVEPEPQVDVEPEPIVDVEPEPIVDIEPEPIVEVEPEPQVDVEPEPVVDVEPEPIVDIAPEPIVDIAPEPVVDVEPEPVVDVEPEPIVDIAPEPQVDSINTVDETLPTNVIPTVDLATQEIITVTIQENTSISATVTIPDSNSEPLKYTVEKVPQHGALTLYSATGSYIYTPHADYSGLDSFAFAVNDGSSISVQRVNLEITPLDDASTSRSLEATVSANTHLHGSLREANNDSSQSTYHIVSAPANGTVTVDALGNYIYKPYANYSGKDSFNYIESDGQSKSNIKTLDIVIVPISDLNDSLSESETENHAVAHLSSGSNMFTAVEIAEALFLLGPAVIDSIALTVTDTFRRDGKKRVPKKFSLSKKKSILKMNTIGTQKNFSDLSVSQMSAIMNQISMISGTQRPLEFIDLPRIDSKGMSGIPTHINITVDNNPFDISPIRYVPSRGKTLLSEDFSINNAVLSEYGSFIYEVNRLNCMRDSVIVNHLQMFNSPLIEKSKMELIDSLSKPNSKIDENLVTTEVSYQTNDITKDEEEPDLPEKHSYEADLYTQSDMSVAAIAVMEDIRGYLPENHDDISNKILEAIKEENKIDHINW